MFEGIFRIIRDIVLSLVQHTVGVISMVFNGLYEGSQSLIEMEFNLTLFSDTPIFTTNIYDLLLLIFTIFYSIFFIVLLYKTTKKVIKSVLGVLKWW